MRPSRVIAVSVALVVLILVLGLLSPYALASSHLWSQRFGSTGDDDGSAVAFDPSGRIFLAGDFSGTVDFGGGPLVSAGSEDIYLAKYTSAGVHLWSRRFGGTGPEFPSEVAVDASGNVVVTGNFTGTVDFGGGPLVSAGSSDVFLAKYNAGGAHVWSKRFGSTSNEGGNTVAIDASGNVIASGYFTGTVDFGGGNLISLGGIDVFLAMYNSAGTHVWSQRFGGTSSDTGRGLAIDSTGDIVVVGSFAGTANFGGANLVSAGGGDVFLAKYTSAGAHVWSQRQGGTSTDDATDIAVDASDEVLMTGHFGATTNLGGASLVSAGAFDAFLARYSTGGAHEWSQRFGGTSNEFSYTIDVSAAGDIAIAGSFVGSADFGGGNLVGNGINDTFVARYDAAGVHQWSRGAGGALADNAGSVVFAADGGLLLTGYFQDVADFGGGDLGSAGLTDAFFVRYSARAPQPAITSISDIGNDQGRKVQIRFDRSGVDDEDAESPVTRYVAFRRDDPPPAGALSPPAPAVERATLAAGWTEVGSVLAFAEESYGMVVPTVGDSTISQGQYYSVFYVRAATDIPSRFFDSRPDSGYSVDNLAPGVPSGLVLAAGQLEWDESTAADFDYFTVYGANADDFGSATVVDYTVPPSMDVTTSPYSFFFVTATDFSGNEGKPAKVSTLSDVGGTPKSYVLSISAYPNPFNPATTIRYTIPSRGRVTVSIYDTRGARVATIVDEEKPAGADTARWVGTNDSARGVSSGVYFARIEHNGATRTKKLVLLK